MPSHTLAVRVAGCLRAVALAALLLTQIAPALATDAGRALCATLA